MGRVVVRSREKKCHVSGLSTLICLFLTFSSDNGGRSGLAGSGGGQKKGNRGRDRCGKFKSSSKGMGVGGGGVHAHPVSSIRGGSASK